MPDSLVSDGQALREAGRIAMTDTPQLFTMPGRSTRVGVCILLITALTVPLRGGWDYLVAIRGETLSRVFVYSYNPYPAYWLFYPFALLPPLVGYVIWNLVNAGGFIYACRYWKSNILLFAISLPCFWIFYGGEFEGFLAGALVVGLTASPWLAGLGIFVLTIKPQVGLIPILYILLQRRDYRLLVIPAALYLLSFVVYGWWVPAWLDHIHATFSQAPSTNISLFPVGLAALLLLFRYWKSPKIGMLAGSLALPYFPVYSLAVLFTLDPPAWWFTLGIWCFYVLPTVIPQLPFLPAFGFLIPILLLAREIWKAETRPKSLDQNLTVVPEE